MPIQPDSVSPVNHNPLPRLGQSVRVLAPSCIGVVVGFVGQLVELAVWPSRRLAVKRTAFVHLTASDACPRSLPDGDRMLAVLAHNRCMPRARDGRCQWCDRELDASHEGAPSEVAP